MEFSREKSVFETAPEVYIPNRNEGLYPRIDSDIEVYRDSLDEKQAAEQPAQRAPPICGIRRRTLIVIRIALIVIFAALVGGLVGGLTTRQETTSPQDASTASASPNQDSSPSSSQDVMNAQSTMNPSMTMSSTDSSIIGTISATALQTIASGTTTIVRDCPSSNGTKFITDTNPPQTFIKRCSFLYDYDSVDKNAPFDDLVTSLNGCINLCAAYNILNGTGPSGPCHSVCWRTDPRYGYWGRCWGAFQPLPGAQITGRNATTEPGSDVPVDSAILA